MQGGYRTGSDASLGEPYMGGDSIDDQGIQERFPPEKGRINWNLEIFTIHLRVLSLQQSFGQGRVLQRPPFAQLDSVAHPAVRTAGQSLRAASPTGMIRDILFVASLIKAYGVEDDNWFQSLLVPCGDDKGYFICSFSSMLQKAIISVVKRKVSVPLGPLRGW